MFVFTNEELVTHWIPGLCTRGLI